MHLIKRCCSMGSCCHARQVLSFCSTSGKLVIQTARSHGISTWQWKSLLVASDKCIPKIKQFWWLEVRAIKKVCWSYYIYIYILLLSFSWFWFCHAVLEARFFQWRHWRISQLSCLYTAFGLLQSCRTKNRIGLWIQQGWIQEVSVCHWVAYRTIRLIQNYTKTSVIVVSLNLVYLYSFSLPLRSCSPFFE